MLIVKQKPFQLLYLIINFFYAQRLIRVIVLPEIYCQKQQLCEEFGTFNVKWRGGVVERWTIGVRNFFLSDGFTSIRLRYMLLTLSSSWVMNGEIAGNSPFSSVTACLFW